MKVKSESEITQSCPTLRDPHGLQPTRLLRPWDFPGKSTGVGCHCLLHVYPLVIEFSPVIFKERFGELREDRITEQVPNWCLLEELEEKAMAPYSSTLAWKIPWMEEPGRLQSMGVTKS